MPTYIAQHQLLFLRSGARRITAVIVGLCACVLSSVPLVNAQEKNSHNASLNLPNETITLTIDEAVQKALKANFELTVGQYTLDKVRITKNASWFAIIPHVSANVSYSKSDSTSEFASMDYSLSADVGISKNLTPALLNAIVGIFQSVEDYRAQKITFEKAVQKTAAQTQKLYFNYAIAQRTLEVFEQRLKVSEVNAKESERAYENGLRDEYTMLQAKLALLTSQQAYDGQKKTADDARMALLIALGNVSMNTRVTLTDDIPHTSDAQIQELLVTTADNNRDMQIQEARLQSLKLQRLSAFFNYLPSVSVSWSSGTNAVNDGNWFDSNNWSDAGKSFSISLEITINTYFPWSTASVRIRTLNKDIAIQKTRINQLSAAGSQKLESLRAQLELLRDAYETNEAQVKIARRAFTLAQEAYRSGLMEIKNYLSAQADLRDAQIKQITQQAEIIKVMLDIKTLAGDVTDAR